jgi:hypothetical protein
VMSAHSYSEAFALPLPETTIWAQRRVCAAITAVGNSVAVYIATGKCQFCCLACMTTYQQRLAPETIAKIEKAMLVISPWQLD